MEAIGNIAVLKTLGNFGVIGLIVFLWWHDQRKMERQAESHQKDLSVILNKYDDDMAEMRQMYRNNASLCKDYSEISKDFKDLIILNTQAMTRLSDVMGDVKERIQ